MDENKRAAFTAEEGYFPALNGVFPGYFFTGL